MVMAILIIFLFKDLEKSETSQEQLPLLKEMVIFFFFYILMNERL